MGWMFQMTFNLLILAKQATSTGLNSVPVFVEARKMPNCSQFPTENLVSVVKMIPENLI